MGYTRNVAVLLGVALLSGYFMTGAYRRARQDAIDQLYAQEKILARQATKGIAEYFAYHQQTVGFFCRNPEVIRITEPGRRLLREWFTAQTNQLYSVTRVDAAGRILYTYPDEQSAGRDISNQPHVRTLLATHQPVVSEVFNSVQGFRCVALHVPVFDGEQFAGSLAVLLPFAEISRKHVEDIRVGESGSAFLLSREGVELFCPLKEHIGLSIYETARGFPGVGAMADRMLQGSEGTSAYDFDVVGSERVAAVRKHAYYLPIKLENTFWSLCVTAPEEEALAFIKGFRDRWLVGVSLLLVAVGVWGFFLIRAFVTLHRERTRREAEARVRAAEREREQALAESENRFRTYFENSLLAMAMSAPDQRWLAVNERLTQLLGYSREELLAMTWVQMTHPDDLAADLRQFERMMAGEMAGFSMEKRFFRKDQTVVPTILSVRLIRRPDGAPDHCLVQLQDISEHKRAEAERRRLEEKLRQSQKLEAIGQLAGGVAHDFNNLLTVQLGHLNLLQFLADLPAEARESLDEIEKSAKMAAQLTRQLLAFSRRQVLQIKRLDLNEVLDQLLKMLRRVLRDDISLELKIAREPLWLDADAGMMEQVIMNLVVNAGDAMPAGGRLTLATELVEFSAPPPPAHPEARPGRFVCLSVRDTGKGMDELTRQRIFEPFFTTKEVGKGTGLGLATVYGIVQQHHGWVEVQSAPDQGSVFRVFYPAADAPPHADAGTETDGPVNLRGNGETLLVAEDDPAVSRTMSAALKRLNYRVLSAANSEAAQRLWQAHREEIRLLVTDMVMTQGANGLELANRLRAERPELPVIIVSGYSRELVAGGLAVDMTFLPKPYTLKALAEVLAHSLKPARQPA